MRKLTIILNIIFLVLTGFNFFTGSVASLLMVITYSMTLGAVLTTQKKFFSISAIILNVFYLLCGIFIMLVIVSGNTAIKEMELIEMYFLGVFIILASLVLPTLNIKYIKSNMGDQGIN